MVTEDYILAKVRKLAILPTFPKIVSEVLGLIADPMSSASDLARHMDPSMTGEVLRVANTAYFGTSNFRRIYSAERAIAVMGYEHLSFIILQMPFLALINVRDTRFDKKAFINHSVACGILSRDISTLLFETDHNEVYVSGILHDIGRIILYHLFKEEWQTMLKAMEEGSLSTVEAERGTFLMDHGQVGAMLLDTWNLPRAITDGVRFHHDTESASENRDNVVAIHLGNELAKRIDLTADLGTFDEFVGMHRDFFLSLREALPETAPSDEVHFFSKMFEELRAAQRFLGYMQDDDATRTGR